MVLLGLMTGEGWEGRLKYFQQKKSEHTLGVRNDELNASFSA